MPIAQAGADELPRPGPLRLHGVFWNALGHGSVAYALTELLDNMPRDGVDRSLWFLGGRPLSPRDYFRPALPMFAYRALCKVGTPAHIQGWIADAAVLRAIRPGDIIYMWPPYDLRLIKRAKERGAIVVAERTNCMGPMGRERLTRAFARRGEPLPARWYPEDGMAEELEQMHACDYVTAPNALVTQSLRESGIPETKILDTFYGFNPTRLAAAIGIERPMRPPVFAFVGLGIVRKGFDVLLEAWQRANIDGTLLIAGQVEDEVREAYADTLSRPDVQLLGYVKDIAEVYAAADVFVFPTHEEGGPQVIYEAAGCGLASIVSPMGAGRIVRDGIECLLIDPLSVDDLAAAITRLATDEGLRRAMGAAAAERARRFTWTDAATSLYLQFRAIAAR
jgi:glycosyltransferase involved in cell wall biosynthesis